MFRGLTLAICAHRETRQGRQKGIVLSFCAVACILRAKHKFKHTFKL